MYVNFAYYIIGGGGGGIKLYLNDLMLNRGMKFCWLKLFDLP